MPRTVTVGPDGSPESRAGADRVAREATLRGLPVKLGVGTGQDLGAVFQLHAAGLTRVIHETRPLISVNESIDEVLRGEVKARLVFDLQRGR